MIRDVHCGAVRALLGGLMSFYDNDRDHLGRRVLDALPYTMRRQALAFLRPATAQALREIRAGGGDLDLTGYEKARAIFAHVPKAAGVSIRRALFPGPHPGHMTLHYYSLAFTRREFYSAFRFAFVRNPWDRLLSAYRYLRSGGRHPDDAVFSRDVLSRYESFDDFVLRGLEDPKVLRFLHFIPQERFLTLGAGHMPLSFVGYFEQLEGDFRHVAQRLGLGHTELPHDNATVGGKADYRTVYTPVMIDRVADVYREDIRLLGYGFDSLHPISLNRRNAA